MESSAKLTGSSLLSDGDGSLRRGLTGVAVGSWVVLVVWLVEAAVSGRNPIELHLSSIAVWVVDALPIVLGLAMHETRTWTRTAPASSGIVPPPQPPDRLATPPPAPALDQDLIPTPMVPPVRREEVAVRTPDAITPRMAPRAATPPPDATPPPVPRSLASPAVAAIGQVASIPKGMGRTILVVDGSPEGPQVAAWLDERGFRVVHVGEAASGSLAREAEDPDLAVLDGGGLGVQALIGELGRHEVPLVVIGGASLALPRRAVRTLRPPTARRLGEALEELVLMEDLD